MSRGPIQVGTVYLRDAYAVLAIQASTMLASDDNRIVEGCILHLLGGSTVQVPGVSVEGAMWILGWKS